MWTATKKLADGRITYYAYAWKGGPLVGKGVGKSKDEARAAMEADLASPDGMARVMAARNAQKIKPAPSIHFIEGIVRAYLKSPEWEKLAPRTKSDWRHHLDDFRAEFGDWRTALFEDPRVVQDLAEWRDDHPSVRQGQMRIEVVSRLFSWARSRGMTTAKPTEPLTKIYKADRAELIWNDEQLAAVKAVSGEPLRWAIDLAVETGLRQGDLIALPWSAISDVSIQYRTAKRKKSVIIPVTEPIRSILADIPKRSPVVLTSSTERAWTGDGLRASFDSAKKRAGIEGLRWHDFRGTAVTRLAKTDLKLRDIARIIGWSEDRVERIMERYVSADAVALDMLKRMNGEQSPQTAHKPEDDQ
ncbi:MAG: tyrosine-type recombinase/integrase [Pseudomonadota bacterium]